MITNSPSVATGSAGDGTNGSWLRSMNVGVLREVALLPVLAVLLVVGALASPAFAAPMIQPAPSFLMSAACAASLSAISNRQSPRLN